MLTTSECLEIFKQVLRWFAHYEVVNLPKTKNFIDEITKCLKINNYLEKTSGKRNIFQSIKSIIFIY